MSGQNVSVIRAVQRSHFSEEEIIGLIAMIGLFNYFNRFNDVLRMEPTQ
jgi:alkylhydroperoxidase family enzyme